jgi:uncharacterized protein YndB with AHSA1/START domain
MPKERRSGWQGLSPVLRASGLVVVLVRWSTRRTTTEGRDSSMNGYVAEATVQIDAIAERVWAALTEPDQIAAYMMGSRVETDWSVGSPITWNGEWEGKPYQDRGEVLAFDPPRRLSVTHFSPLGGQDDVPANYHTLVYELSEDGGTTTVALTQDNNDSEEQAEQFAGNWSAMLNGLKQQVEGG